MTPEEYAQWCQPTPVRDELTKAAIENLLAPLPIQQAMELQAARHRVRKIRKQNEMLRHLRKRKATAAQVRDWLLKLDQYFKDEEKEWGSGGE